MLYELTALIVLCVVWICAFIYVLWDLFATQPEEPSATTRRIYRGQNGEVVCYTTHKFD